MIDITLPFPVSTNALTFNRKNDLGNLEKGLTDLLVTHGLIEDDKPSIVRSITLSWSPYIKGARVMVTGALEL